MDIEKAWCIHKSSGSRSKQLYSNCHYATSSVWLPYSLRYWSRLDPGSGREKMGAGNVPFKKNITSVLHYFGKHGCEKRSVEIKINSYVWLMFFFWQTWPCHFQTHKIYIESRFMNVCICFGDHRWNHESHKGSCSSWGFMTLYIREKACILDSCCTVCW